MLRATGPRSINRRIIVLSLDHQVCFLMNKYLREAKRSAIFLDCLQSTFSLKIRLVLISSSAIPNHDVIITETRREKTDCLLFCSKQTLRQTRNGVTDWSIAQVLTDHWLVCGEIATNKNSHASQPIANNNETSSNLSNKTFKDILQKETAVNFPKGNAILPDLKKE